MARRKMLPADDVEAIIESAGETGEIAEVIDLERRALEDATEQFIKLLSAERDRLRRLLNGPRR